MGIANVGIVRAEGERVTSAQTTDLVLIQRIDSTTGQYSPRMITAQNLIQNTEIASTRTGTATLVAGTVTVANTTVTANTMIFLTRKGLNGATGIGHLHVSAVSAGVSFTITSVNASAATETNDVSIVQWILFEAE